MDHRPERLARLGEVIVPEVFDDPVLMRTLDEFVGDLMTSTVQEKIRRHEFSEKALTELDRRVDQWMPVLREEQRDFEADLLDLFAMSVEMHVWRI